MNFQGKTVIITGGASGMGLLCRRMQKKDVVNRM